MRYGVQGSQELLELRVNFLGDAPYYEGQEPNRGNPWGRGRPTPRTESEMQWMEMDMDKKTKQVMWTALCLLISVIGACIQFGFFY